MNNNDKNVKITLITVCYNSGDTIGRTIDSVCTQNYDDLEYIIIDGASTDNTLEIIKQKTEGCSYEFKLVSEPDNGIFDAMNKGLKMATGDLICMLNSDDWLTDNALKIVSEKYTGEDYLVIYGMERRIRDGKEKECFLYGHEFIPERSLAHQACYVTKKIYDKFGLYDTQYRSAADTDFFIRLYLSKEVSFLPVYDVLINFTDGGMSSSCLGNIEGAKVRKKYGAIGTGQYLYIVFRAIFLKMIGKM